MFVPVLLILALPAAAGERQASVGIGPPASDCPTPRMGPPRYPKELLNHMISGKVVLSVAVDECGRVMDAAVAHSSAHAQFDKAALDVARTWVFSPTGATKNLLDGRLRIPLTFMTR